jgi:hypothetical protein
MDPWSPSEVVPPMQSTRMAEPYAEWVRGRVMSMPDRLRVAMLAPVAWRVGTSHIPTTQSRG